VCCSFATHNQCSPSNRKARRACKEAVINVLHIQDPWQC
jgi:hypothetical protein